MSNMSSSDINISSSIVPDIDKIMVEVERQAKARYNKIMEDVEAGKYTLDDVKQC